MYNVCEMVYYRQHPDLPWDSGHTSYKHIKSNIADELTISSQVVAKIIFINWIRFYVVSCNNTYNTFHAFIPLFIHLHNYALSQNVLNTQKYMYTGSVKAIDLYKLHHVTSALYWMIGYMYIDHNNYYCKYSLILL